jgi:hypothetical protein
MHLRSADEMPSRGLVELASRGEPGSVEVMERPVSEGKELSVVVPDTIVIE